MLTRETVTFRDASRRSWEFDLTFMLSNYRCIWGRGCPDTGLQGTAHGCCVDVVEIYLGDDRPGREDLKKILGRVRQLTDADWQNGRVALPRGGRDPWAPRSGIREPGAEPRVASTDNDGGQWLGGASTAPSCGSSRHRGKSALLFARGESRAELVRPGATAHAPNEPRHRRDRHRRRAAARVDSSDQPAIDQVRPALHLPRARRP
jgi:hypothetical protein